MKKYWKAIVITGLILGAGYLIFCLAYDACEDYRRSLPDRKFKARMDNIERKVDAFAAKADSEMPAGTDMLFWEQQSWETGGGRSRLTLWQDGRSEARVEPCYYDAAEYMLKIEPGWKQSEENGNTVLVRDAVFTVTEAQKRFRNSFRLGVHLLVPVKRDYEDGGGLVIGIRRNGDLTQQVFPEFPSEQWETDNYIRFKALSRLLGEFDNVKVYSIIRRQAENGVTPEDKAYKSVDNQQTSFQWCSSDDGKISALFAVEKTTLDTNETVILRCSVSNNTDKALTVLRPFGDSFYTLSCGLTIAGPAGPMKYDGVMKSYCLGTGDFIELKSHTAVEETLKLPGEVFPGFGAEGYYEISNLYISTGYPKQPPPVNYWEGYVKSKPVRILISSVSNTGSGDVAPGK